MKLTPKQEFYTKDLALIVVKLVAYPAGQAVTFLKRGPDGKMAGGFQMLVSELEKELADDLCGEISTEPSGKQQGLVGKIPAEMNAYFNQ